MRKRKKFIIGAAIGSGLAARSAEQGGADFVLATSAGRIRNMGAPSISCVLPLGDATRMSLDFAVREVLPQVSIPVYLGINVWSGLYSSPEWRDLIREFGFAGAVNFPGSMHISHELQATLRSVGLGVQAEIDLLTYLRGEGLSVLFYCGSHDHVMTAVDAGIDSIIYNFGWNVGGARGHKSQISLNETAAIARDVCQYVKRRNHRAKVYLEGGPIVSASDLNFIARTADIDGYVGGSTIDKFPIETAIGDCIARFKSAAIPSRPVSPEVQRILKSANRHGLVGQSEPNLTFLKDFHCLASSKLNVELVCEQGANIRALIEFFADAMGGVRPRQIAQVEPSADPTPERMLSRVFGSSKGGLRGSGLLSDSELRMLVVHQPADMPSAVREGFEHLIKHGCFRCGSGREHIALAPRILFISHGTSIFERLSQVAHGLPLAVTSAPPLRVRSEDIETLIERKMHEIAGRSARAYSFSPSALQVLRFHSWPGNEGELHRVILRILNEGETTIDGARARKVIDDATGGKEKLRTVRNTHKDVILQALIQHGFRKGETAKALGISRKTLYNWLSRLDLY